MIENIEFELELLIHRYKTQRYQNIELNNKCIELCEKLIEAEKQRKEEYDKRMFGN